MSCEPIRFSDKLWFEYLDNLEESVCADASIHFVTAGARLRQNHLTIGEFS